MQTRNASAFLLSNSFKLPEYADYHIAVVFLLVAGGEAHKLILQRGYYAGVYVGILFNIVYGLGGVTICARELKGRALKPVRKEQQISTL